MAPDARSIAERFLEYLTSGDASRFQAVCASGLVVHATSMDYDVAPNRLVQHGLERLNKLRAANLLALPDIRYSIDNVVTDDNAVAFKWTGTGTHLGPLAWAPPTRGTITMNGTCRMAFARDLVSEIWLDFDLYHLLDQLGRICSEPGQAIGNAVAVNRSAMAVVRNAIVNRESTIAGFENVQLRASIRTYTEDFQISAFRFTNDGELAALLACLRQLFTAIALTVDDGVSQGSTTTFRGKLVASSKFTHHFRCGFESPAGHVARCWLEIMPPPTIREYLQ